jgi:hypothetical protein
MLSAALAVCSAAIASYPDSGYAIGKGHSVSVVWRGGEVDTIFGFEKEADALEWIKKKSQGWLLDNKRGGLRV